MSRRAAVTRSMSHAAACSSRLRKTASRVSASASVCVRIDHDFSLGCDVLAGCDRRPESCRGTVPSRATVSVVSGGLSFAKETEDVMRGLVTLTASLFLLTGNALAQAVSPSEYAPCRSALACSAGPGGGRSIGPGGGLSIGPGGGLSIGPGGGLSIGPGGGMSIGPGGGLSIGPGGGMSIGPGGGLSPDGSYKGPWTPCLTGVMGVQWTRENCPS